MSEYKTDEYLNKVFKYFTLELIKENEHTNVLTNKEIENLLDNDLKINKDNLKEQPENIQNLYNDIMSLKENYIFAYFLSRLYEIRISQNKDESANKYIKYFNYIISLKTDFSKLDWSNYNKIKRLIPNLYNIYGEKMHKITNEYLKNGFIKEVTDKENIDDIIKLYLKNVRLIQCDFKISKLTKIEDNKIDKSKIIYKLDDNNINFNEINEWYYGNNNDKQIFEKIVLNIVKNNESKHNASRLIEKVITELIKFVCIYLCLLVFVSVVLNNYENILIYAIQIYCNIYNLINYVKNYDLEEYNNITY